MYQIKFGLRNSEIETNISKPHDRAYTQYEHINT